MQNDGVGLVQRRNMTKIHATVAIHFVRHSTTFTIVYRQLFKRMFNHQLVQNTACCASGGA